MGMGYVEGREDRPERGSPSLLWWDLGMSLILVVLGVLGVILADVERSPNWAGGASPAARYTLLLAPLLLFALLYAALGRRVLRLALRDEPTGGIGSSYLAALVAVVAYGVLTEPMYALLQAVAYPMVWTTVMRYRDAVLWSSALALAVSLSMFAGIATESVGAGLLSAAFTGPLSLAFAITMGTWITRIYAQGERYRELAERLRDSQAEVAALSQATGAAAERERLSRELHDTLTQTLTGLVMLSEQVERALAEGDRAKAEDRLARVGSAAREALVEARALVASTQPLGDGGLVDSIERVAARFGADTGLRIRCELEPVPLDREREVVLLRAAQEGLANARKHARAEAVRVSLVPLPEGGALLTVEDDGIGPRMRAEGPAGFGLSGLAERVRAVGGTVEFGRGGAGGARLDVRLPAGRGER